MTDRTTTDGRPPAPGSEHAGAPQPINPATGQHGAYWVLTPEERAKGFVRPVRDSYIHVGRQAKYPLRDLTLEERECYATCDYVKFEIYPESESPITGRFWTAGDLNRAGCGAYTRMSRDIAETYARDPKFYGSTFCVRCCRHLAVSEFVWVGADGLRTTEVVGS